MYAHILLPTDGSELAQAGVKHGLALARQGGGRVTVVTVTEPLGGQFAFAADLWTPSQSELERYDAAQRAIAERVLSSVLSMAREFGVTIDALHVPGRLVAPAVVDTAQALGCDAIVMSSHGRTGMGRVVLGSQTAGVLSSATVPVIVVR